MATIQTVIQLIDRISAPMGYMASSADRLYTALDRVDDSMNFNTSGLEAAEMEVNRINTAYEQTEQNIRSNVEQQEQLNESMNQGAANGNKLLSSVKKMAAAYVTFQTAKKEIEVSDKVAMSEARLSLLVDDGGSVQELENKIFASAQRSSSVYQDNVNSISRLGLLAGKSFSGMDEIITFQELMNKNFIVGGSSATEQASAMYQLTQAMSAGKLQGDEYRSIIENAPLLANAIEDYMVNVQGAEGSMKDWASEGLLTASVIKNALFSTADDVDGRFNEMPMNFGQIWTSIQNKALFAFDPILKKLNEIANSERFNQFADGVTSAIVAVGGVLNWIFGLIGDVGGFLYENWSIISPVIYGVAAALAVYAGYLGIVNALELISAARSGVMAVAKGILATVTWATTSATWAQVTAQMGLNAAMYACPITWILIIIIAIIAALYAVVAIINKVAGTSVSATGIIFGVFSTLGAFLWNLFLGLLELVFGIIEALVNPFIKFANFIGNIFANPISSIIYMFQGMADGVLAVLEKIASAMDFVFGSSMADTVAGWRSGLKDMADSAVEKYAPNENYQKVIDELDLSVENLGLNRWAYSDAWDAGYSAGENLEEAIGNFDPASLFNTDIPDVNDYTGSYDPSQYLSNIADDTDSIADSMEMTGEELKYLRDIAERDAVNKFTLAEIKVEQTNSFGDVRETADLDGVVSYLEEKVDEALEAVAEGVHE
ncbi:MAG: tape measure protein [Eubacteriales bacterium]|nr:tape measure protein [Eubacteriales bacterium]